MVRGVFKASALWPQWVSCWQLAVKNNGPSEVAPKDQVITLSTTLSLGDETSKALTPDGVKTFAAGEQIAVIYTNTSDRTVKATSDALIEEDIFNQGKTARFTVTITNPKAGTVDYVYPAVMAKDDGSMASISAQDGTLETISGKYDYARGSGWMNVDESDATLPSDIELTNPLAICKFILKNADTDITDGITALTITSGEDSYHINRTAGAGPIFVALKPVSDADLSFAATDGTKYYAKAVYGKTLEGGKMVPITLNMNAVAAYTSYIRHGWDADARTVTSETVVESARHLNEASSSAYASLSGTWYVTGTLDLEKEYLRVTPNKTLNLVLCDGAHLKAKALWVDHTGTLRIFGQTVTIDITSCNPLIVEAIGGEDCGSAGAIGSYDSDRFGTLKIGDRVKVQTYNSAWVTLETNVNRSDKIHRIRHAKLTTCDHPGYTADTCPYCTH